MSFSTPTLFLAFLAMQTYAVTIHFTRPTSGLSSPGLYHLLRFCVASSITLSVTPILAPTPTSIALPSCLLFSASLALFAWSAATTRPGKFAVIFGRVTPERVVSSGPFAHVRHPTYVSYVLGWLAAVLVVLCDALAADGRGGERWVSGTARAVGVLCAVGSLFWTYYRGAVLEEMQFLENRDTVQGRDVGGDVSGEYRAYMRRVPYRWLPGVV